MSKKKISPETLEGIVVNRLFFGLDTQKICEQYGMSNSFVNATVSAYKAVESKDWDRVRFLLEGKQTTLNVIEWAAGRIGLEIPDELIKPAPVTVPVPVEQLEGQTKMPECNYQEIRFSHGTNNTIHALIDALNRNTAALCRLAGES